MSVSSPLKLVVATWIAAVLGALAGRSLADLSGDPLHGATRMAIESKLGMR